MECPKDKIIIRKTSGVGYAELPSWQIWNEGQKSWKWGTMRDKKFWMRDKMRDKMEHVFKVYSYLYGRLKSQWNAVVKSLLTNKKKKKKKYSTLVKYFLALFQDENGNPQRKHSMATRLHQPNHWHWLWEGKATFSQIVVSHYILV